MRCLFHQTKKHFVCFFVQLIIFVYLFRNIGFCLGCNHGQYSSDTHFSNDPDAFIIMERKDMLQVGKLRDFRRKYFKYYFVTLAQLNGSRIVFNFYYAIVQSVLIAQIS